MRDVVIVFAGTKFTEGHVEQKRRQLDKYCSIPTRLTVLTDDPARINAIGLRDTRSCLLPDTWQLEGHRKLWWYKCFMFSQSLSWLGGDVLYMDLDTVIINNVEHLWNYNPGKFCILQDFNRAFIAEYPVSNSSVMRFNPKIHTDIHEYFDQDWQQLIRKFRGDQDYLTWWLKDRESYWWPKQWCMSYKWEIKHGGSRHGGTDLRWPIDYYEPDIAHILPEDCSIAVFHGEPDPFDTVFGNNLHYLG